jgi:hypothetical protein
MTRSAPSQLKLMFISLAAAPAIGLLAMLGAWAVVDTENRGEIDFGVLLFGACMAGD